MNEYGKIQLNALSQIKSFFKKYNNKKFNPYKNNLFYLSSFANSCGVIKLKSFLNNNLSLKKNFIIILKDFFYTSYYFSNSLYYNFKKNNFNKIIVSWAYKKNFNLKGIYKDKFYNVSSNYKKKKILWFLIYVDRKLPKKISNNIVIFQPIKKKNINFLFLLKIFLIRLKYIFFSLDFYIHSLSSHTYLSEKIVKNLNIFLHKNIRTIEMPYEGQPFQNEIIRLAKKKNIKTIGFAHGAPLPLPSNLIKKSSSPDKLIINGIDQKILLEKHLGWSNKELELKPSSRFLKKQKLEKNTIYLPAKIKQLEVIKSSLSYLVKKNFIDFNKFKIKKHPASFDSKYIDFTINSLSKIKKHKISIKELKYNNALIFIGITGGVIEALEKNMNVIHITEEPDFDLYTSNIWPNISSIKIHANIYVYKLKKKNQMLKFGNYKTRYI